MVKHLLLSGQFSVSAVTFDGVILLNVIVFVDFFFFFNCAYLLFTPCSLNNFDCNFIDNFS